MTSLTNSKLPILQRLTKSQRHVYILLLLVLLTGGPALSFAMSRITPGVNPDIYVFLVQIACIIGHLFIFRSAHALRARFIGLFFLVVGTLLFIGMQR